ncbi:ShlB/FhaC/HecB family hemolysin secretion/activation protein [Candidatus Gracilibacteria bacterium]|nr:ShlB/FhaC/HecB family hemolysin secretion/activation protein [Candidatus Gracilibacteria bacterium]NJP21024.1 ShlB/FhaC/HecB family hemolysin secretion/activation protein [Hydrococcus sp. CRU_1_1]
MRDEGYNCPNISVRGLFFLSSYLSLFSLFSNTPAARSQSIPRINPPAPEQPLPSPLPPTEKPLQQAPIAPPTPEEVLDIRGTITVERFEFVGNSAFSQEELNKAVAEYIGKPVVFAQLLQAANKITEFYVQKGYITSGAYIPAQEIQTGVVKIQVVEGSLEAIEVNVTEGRLNPNYVRSRLEIATEKPLNVNRLQEALQLLQLDPLIDSLKAELSAGTKPGTNLLQVSAVGADTFSVRLDLNNNRNPSVGTFERGIEIAEANLFGLGDRISAAYYNTDGSDRIETSYSLPINSYNGTLDFRFQYTNNEIIEPPLDDFDIEVESRDFELTYRQPVLRRATSEVTQELALSLTAARRESDASIQGIDFPLFPGANEKGETRITEFNFAQEWLQRSRQDVLAARSQFSLGIGTFDATVNDEEPDSRFFLWRGQFLYLRRLDVETDDPESSPTLLLRSDIQLSSVSLLSREQFSLGGQTTIRGYRQDALLADNGFLVSAELRVPILRVPDGQGTLQVAPFIDFGKVWNSDRDNPNPSNLLGIGLGLLWQIGDNFTARLDWGIPLTDIDSNKRTLQENGVYFQIQYSPF